MNETNNQIWTYIIPVIGLVIAAITAVGVFYGPRLVAKRREKWEKLRVHFEDLKSKVVDPLISVTYDIDNDNEKVLYEYEPMEVDHPSTLPNYEFEQCDSFVCFSLHFPEVVAEWGNLKEKAANHDKSLKELEAEESRKKLISSAEGVVRDFRNFALKLEVNIDSITKYEMGKAFKKHKNCPICKKI